MKFSRGSVLLVSLWVLAILAVLAVGLTKRALASLRSARYQRDRLRASCLARGQVHRAAAVLERDACLSEYDSLSEEWNGQLADGLRIACDEERKININNASPVLLEALFNHCQQQYAGELADYFYAHKRKPFALFEELVPLAEVFYRRKGVEDPLKEALGFFARIKDLATVYGDKNSPVFKVNVNTVSEEILGILALAEVLENKGERSDAALVSGGIISQREARDEGYFEKLEDIDANIVAGTSEDENLVNKLTEHFILKSSYFKIDSAARVGSASKKITAVYNRGSKKISYWHEN